MLEHNDFEIIYEIREGNHEALELMFSKYKKLISKKIHQFNLVYEYDDMMQEGYMMLYKAINTYNDEKGKTFTRYFEMNLTNKFISIVSKRVRRKEIFNTNELYIYETNHSVNGSSVYYELYKEEIAKILTKEEFIVYTLRELKNYSISFIVNKLDSKDKIVYNRLHRAKSKIKAHFKN